MQVYCVVNDAGVTHVVPGVDFGRTCVCGRKVLALTDDGGATVRNARTRERLSALVLFQTAARKTATGRALWEAALFC